MNGTETPGAGLARSLPISYKWLALIIAATGLLLTALNMGLVIVALPTISQEFDASLSQIQWVLAIYPLITVGLTLAAGYFGDVMGRKPIFIAGALTFATGSALSALAQATWQLIAFRGLQAVAGSIMMATAPAIIADAFPSSERGKAFGIMSMVTTTGLSIGPSIGGLMVDRVGWRLAFSVVVPVAALVALLAVAYLREEPVAKTGQRFDFAGTALMFVTAASFLLALSEGQDNGWVSWRVLILGGVSLVGLLAIVPVERRVALPALDLAIIRNRLFAAASVTGLIANLVFSGLLFLVPFQLTLLAGYSLSEAGILLAVITGAMALVTPISGRLSDRLGSRGLCAAGMAVSSLSVAAFAQLGAQPDRTAVALLLAIYGIGFAIMLPPNTSAAMGTAQAARLGTASAMYNTIRQLGIALGVTISGVVFSARLTAYSGPGATSLRAGLFDPVGAVGAFRDAYLVLAFCCALGIASSIVRQQWRSSARGD